MFSEYLRKLSYYTCLSQRKYTVKWVQTHIHTYGQLGGPCLQNLHIFGLWEKTRENLKQTNTETRRTGKSSHKNYKPQACFMCGDITLPLSSFLLYCVHNSPQCYTSYFISVTTTVSATLHLSVKSQKGDDLTVSLNLNSLLE